MNDITSQLLSWYRHSGRLLPWRETKDPYRIWLSEVILQQTRVDQGLPYYLRFVEAYPDIFLLATSAEHEVFKLWQGLGYYSRARNLLRTAQHVVNDFNGVFPSDLKTLQSLPGIGPYTAAAISSLAYGLPNPVVDGNVYRVISRLYGVTTPVPSLKAHAEFVKISQSMMSDYDPAYFNQAMMELGALVCTPKNPQCADCPFRSACFAYRHGQTEKFPVQMPKTKQKIVHLHYIVISTTNVSCPELVLRHRSSKGIWAGLYDFPCVETENPVMPEEILAPALSKIGIAELNYHITGVSTEYKHLLTHRILKAKFISVSIEIAALPELKKPLLLVKQSSLPNYPVPVLVDKFLHDLSWIKE